MKQLSVLVALILLMSVLIFALVIPNVGLAKDEVLVREWTEYKVVNDTSKVVAQSKSETTTSDSSSSHTNSKEKTVTKISKKEVLVPEPFEFSRAVHFDPIVIKTIDTLSLDSDTLEL